MIIIEKVKQFFLAGNELVISFNDYLADTFGRTIQIAVDWILIGLLLVLLLRLFKFSFDVLRYVVVPSVVVSGLLAAFTSLSFLFVMPLAMGVGTVLMIFKS